jgi:putative DNA primase/helicase
MIPSTISGGKMVSRNDARNKDHSAYEDYYRVPWQGKEPEEEEFIPPLANKLTIDRAGMLALDLPPIEQICGPLASAGVTMIAGAAGVGKSLFSLHMAGHIACGEDFESWAVPKPRKVLYVDGEMAPQYMQTRLHNVLANDNLTLINLHTMRECDAFIDMSQQHWRDYFLADEWIQAYDLFIFDTVSSLVLTNKNVDPFSPEFWLQLEPFHQQFRAEGKTVIWVDNLNKNGTVFGTSVKHHKVDSLWMFNEWKGKPTRTGFTIETGKNRGDKDDAEGNWYLSSDGQWSTGL